MDLVSRSKFLSKILRHDPGIIGITLDQNGWADVAELIQRVRWSKAELDTIVSTDNKKRYEYSSDGTKIRASQGHSIQVDLALVEKTPPATLYHGTCDAVEANIRNSGIAKMSRNHVHLSVDEATAIKVGQRHGKPVVLEVDAQAMVADGVKFYLSNNNVWLTAFVDKKYIKPAQNAQPNQSVANSFF